METAEAWGIAANVEGDRTLRHGANVTLLSIPGDGKHMCVRGLNRQGRTIDKWVTRKRLTNFRPLFIADEGRLTYLSWGTKEQALEMANLYQKQADELRGGVLI